MAKLDYRRMRNDDRTLYKQLLFSVVRWFIAGLQPKVIVREVYSWARTNAKKYYSNKGESNLTSNWVSRRVKESAQDSFRILKLSFEAQELMEKIRRNVINADNIDLTIAPDEEELLSQVWFKFDEILAHKVKTSRGNRKVVVGVSGGSTLLSISKLSAKYKTLLRWHASRDIPESKKKKVVVCSLTSGGTRDNIAALSDTVAALIAQELGVKARGLLGPALFPNRSARASFEKDPEVSEHIGLVRQAAVILTSVGYLGGEAALTSQVLGSIDGKYLKELRKKYKHLADILYNCYDGFTGESIPFPPKVSNRIFSVISCEGLHDMVANKRTECIVAATGYNKGYHSMRGIMAKKMATHIYMDVECAKGLIKAAEEHG